jgi:hypothetical protein
VWILLTLAANSMAQPSGRICGGSVRYRIYLCSSPFFAFSDGLSIVTRVITAAFYLHVSPLKASRLAILARADERHHTFRNKDSCFDDPFPEPVANEDSVPPSASSITPAWPRWLFFVVGTVPAAIQLASFWGMPGTKAIGLMFICSFTIIEVITCLASFKEEHKTIPSLLGYLKVDGITIEEQEDRFKVLKLIRRLEWFETGLFVATLLAHLVLMFHVVHPIWAVITLPTRNALHAIPIIKLLYTIFSTIDTIVHVLTFMRFIAWIFGPWSILDRYMSTERTFWIMISTSCLLDSIKYNPTSTQPTSGFWDKFMAICIVVVLFSGSNFGMSKLCTRFPIIARIFLIDRRPWDTAKVEHLPERQRTGTELEDGVIHTNAWTCFCIFLSNLVLCVLWYKVVYNDAGTANPSWTYIFG